MSERILELESVTAGYGETHILNGISFHVDSGERLAIIGRNGVGKTTTLATIMGFTQMHHGEIRLGGEPINALPTHQRAIRGLGLVPQTRDIFPSLNVEENLISGIRGDATLDEAYELFPRLKERRRNGGGQLSGGEQQMLSIARTLLGRPRLLMLDEPLEGLAPVICELLMGTFEKLATEQKQTIILVEQHAQLALEFADRAIIIENGEIAHTAPSEDILANPHILDRHLGLGVAG